MIAATFHIRSMRGRARSHLMMCSDNYAYVVKFQNNPQHLRVLANEFLATSLALTVGLTLPQVQIVDVSQFLISTSTELVMERGEKREPCKAGFQFGSRLVGGPLPGTLVDCLPESYLANVINRPEFAGMLAFDKWTSNADGRQAVFHKRMHERRYMASFVDQGDCFDSGGWTFNDSPLRGVFARDSVYGDVTGWDDFEPWLSSIENIDLNVAWNVALKIPQDWLGGPKIELEILIDRLFARRNQIRDLITEFRLSSRGPFPKWKESSYAPARQGYGQVLSWKPCEEC